MVGKKTENKAVGRTRGGLNTKIHAIVDALGNPAAFLLSPGNDNDSSHAIELMGLTDITGSNLLGDKAYGTKEILAYIKEHNAVVVIPPKSNTKEPWAVDYYLYKERHLVECFFQKIKWFRRVATRFDKLDKSFLAFVYLAAIMIWLLSPAYRIFQTRPSPFPPTYVFSPQIVHGEEKICAKIH